MKELESFYVSFGQAHRHTGQLYDTEGNDVVFDKDCLCQIDAESYTEAANIAHDTFGHMYSIIYYGRELPGILKSFPRGVIALN